jgi:hypothetical protein
MKDGGALHSDEETVSGLSRYEAELSKVDFVSNTGVRPPPSQVGKNTPARCAPRTSPHRAAAPTWHGKPVRSSHADQANTAQEIAREQAVFFFSSDEPETYRNYCVSFCRQLRHLLRDRRLAGRPVVYYTNDEPAHRTNAAFLLGAYLALVEHWAPEQAVAPIDQIQPSPFLSFRHATHV